MGMIFVRRVWSSELLIPLFALLDYQHKTERFSSFVKPFLSNVLFFYISIFFSPLPLLSSPQKLCSNHLLEQILVIIKYIFCSLYQLHVFNLTDSLLCLFTIISPFIIDNLFIVAYSFLFIFSLWSFLSCVALPLLIAEVAFRSVLPSSERVLTHSSLLYFYDMR